MKNIFSFVPVPMSLFIVLFIYLVDGCNEATNVGDILHTQFGEEGVGRYEQWLLEYIGEREGV